VCAHAQERERERDETCGTHTMPCSPARQGNACAHAYTHTRDKTHELAHREVLAQEWKRQGLDKIDSADGRVQRGVRYGRHTP